MSKKKILYIISEIDKAVQFEWTAEKLKHNFDLHFILYNPISKNPVLAQFLNSLNIPCAIIRNNKKIEIPKIIFSLCHHIKKIQPDIVHTHLHKANLLGLTASKIVGIKKRIYTRHHSSYNHIYHPNKIWQDHYCNFLATDIIAISPLVKKILIEWEKVPASKVHVVPHGFKLDEFTHIPENRVNTIKNKYNITNQQPIIGVISRYTQWKGIQYIIPAFQKLLSDYPDALLILANATGDYSYEIKQMLKNIPKKNYIEIIFENDVFALYKIYDIFIHTPINEHIEAFGQIYVEALAAGVPSIFSLSGIANEFINHRKNAIVVSHQNADEIYNAIKLILSDNKLKNLLIKQGKEDIKQFDFENYMNALKKLYEK